MTTITVDLTPDSDILVTIRGVTRVDRTIPVDDDAPVIVMGVLAMAWPHLADETERITLRVLGEHVPVLDFADLVQDVLAALESLVDDDDVTERPSVSPDVPLFI